MGQGYQAQHQRCWPCRPVQEACMLERGAQKLQHLPPAAGRRSLLCGNLCRHACVCASPPLSPTPSRPLTLVPDLLSRPCIPSRGSFRSCIIINCVQAATWDAAQRAATASRRASPTPSRATAVVCPTPRSAFMMLVRRGRTWTCSPPACTSPGPACSALPSSPHAHMHAW